MGLKGDESCCRTASMNCCARNCDHNCSASRPGSCCTKHSLLLESPTIDWEGCGLPRKMLDVNMAVPGVEGFCFRDWAGSGGAGMGLPWTPGSPIENCSTLWSGFTLTPGWTGGAIDPRGWEAEVCWVLGLSRCGQPNFWSILTGDPSFLHVYSVFSLLWVPGSFLSLLSCLVAGKSVNVAWKEGKEENLDAFRLASFQGKQSEVTNVFDFFFSQYLYFMSTLHNLHTQYWWIRRTSSEDGADFGGVGWLLGWEVAACRQGPTDCSRALLVLKSLLLPSQCLGMGAVGSNTWWRAPVAATQP